MLHPLSRDVAFQLQKYLSSRSALFYFQKYSSIIFKNTLLPKALQFISRKTPFSEMSLAMLRIQKGLIFTPKKCPLLLHFLFRNALPPETPLISSLEMSSRVPHIIS
jgi:hypothetical protein